MLFRSNPIKNRAFEALFDEFVMVFSKIPLIPANLPVA